MQLTDAGTDGVNAESTNFDARELFDQAFGAHRSGDLNSAESLYRQILSAQPENVHVAHLLGVIALQKGKFQQACELIEAAIDRDASHAPFHCNLGEAYRLLGQLDKAEKCFHAALEREPRYPQALTNLGTTLHQRGRYAEAATRFQQLLDTAGPSADAYNNLGLAQVASGAIDEAVSSFRKAVELNPHYDTANNNLGAALLEKNDFEAAASLLENVVGANPGFADAWCNLARARLGQSKHKAAEECARRAIALDPEQAKFHFVLGIVLGDAGRTAEAESAFMRSLEFAPEEAATHRALGSVLVRVGRFAEGAASLRSAIALDPDHTLAYEELSKVHSYCIDDLPEIEQLEQLAEHLTADAPTRASLEFALAKMLEDCNEFDRSFLHLQVANELKKTQVSFDAAGLWQTLAETKRTVTRELIEQNARFGIDTDIPILIVGMPRSGTTLVEQILASHPQVSGAGEAGYVNDVARGLARESGVSYPDCLGNLSEPLVKDLARGYLNMLEQNRGDARYVTDKRPHSFVHLGLFSMLFPKGRIIHCVRDPRDTCFSIYSNNFAKENEFAYDLEHVAEFYRFYRLIMEHWQSTLPNKIFDVTYEELVKNQERVSRELLEHCELAWDDRCLRPHETEREIRSLSIWQVRQPVYASSVARWQRFEHHLGPLINALGDYAQTAKNA